MEIYLVGGAVRDQLLGEPVKERDWVVVGAKASDLLKLGYKQVGRDFPVFLHPRTHEEYALARRERKIGPGYTGFDFDASPNVTLEEDLMRRDLTINAIAQTKDGQLIDPFNGLEDIQKRLLRHVSPAFSEDPVRILRTARFAARFKKKGFKVVESTRDMMREMVSRGEVNALVPERVWRELSRALCEPNPEAFFEVLQDCDAQAILFPHIKLVGIKALKKSVELSDDPLVRFAALTHALNESELQTTAHFLRIPQLYKSLAELVIRYLADYSRINEAKAEDLVMLLKNIDAFRRPGRFEQWLLACEACEGQHKNQTQFLQGCFKAILSLDIRALNKLATGAALSTLIFRERVKVCEQFLLKTKHC